jgi:pseudouridine kinase
LNSKQNHVQLKQLFVKATFVMTEREQQILAILRQYPLIAQQDLADRLGISRVAVAGHIMGLTRKGHVLGKGYVLADARFVLALGGANMDIVASTDLQVVPGDSTPGHISSSPGGVARNVAENLARLGLDVRLISAVGDDFYGRRMLELTMQAGVDVQGCWVWPGDNTSTYLSLHGPDGDLVAAINDMSILERITPEKLDMHSHRVRQAAVVVADCNLSASAMDWLFAHGGDKPIFVEAVSAHKCGRIQPWLGRVHTLKLNRIEAQALTGIEVSDLEQADVAARALCDQGVEHVVLSLGEQGVCWRNRHGDMGLEAAMAVSVVNANGAGDALMAGLVHGHLHGLSLAQAVRFGNGCAALTVTCFGANHPSLSVSAVQKLMGQTVGLPNSTIN